MFRGGELLCDVTMVYVNASRKTQSSMTVPEAFVEAVLGFEEQPPERK
jgi:acyl-CoA thioesterase FadM